MIVGLKKNELKFKGMIYDSGEMVGSDSWELTLVLLRYLICGSKEDSNDTETYKR